MDKEIIQSVQEILSVRGAMRESDIIDYLMEIHDMKHDKALEVIHSMVTDDEISRLEYRLPDSQFRSAVFFPLGTRIDY